MQGKESKGDITCRNNDIEISVFLFIVRGLITNPSLSFKCMHDGMGCAHWFSTYQGTETFLSNREGIASGILKMNKPYYWSWVGCTSSKQAFFPRALT